MVFIPCKDGVSHNPAEYSKPEDMCALLFEFPVCG